MENELELGIILRKLLGIIEDNTNQARKLRDIMNNEDKKKSSDYLHEIREFMASYKVVTLSPNEILEMKNQNALRNLHSRARMHKHVMLLREELNELFSFTD